VVAGGNLLNDGIEMCGLSHAARAAGCDKVIIGIDCTDDDFFVLHMQQWTVCLLVVCGLSHAARAAGRDKVIIRIDCTDDDFCAAYAAVDSMSSGCVWSVSCCTGSGT